MTKASREAADYCPKTAYARTGVATSTRYEIPDECVGKYIWIYNETGATMYVRFGDEDVAVDSTAASTLSTEALTAAGDEPMVIIPDGQAASPRLDSDWTHMAMQGGTSGSWRFGLGTGDGD